MGLRDRVEHDSTAQHPPTGQLPLPFLTVDQAATIDAARAVVDDAIGRAVANRQPVLAAELARLGARLAEILETNAAAHRAAHR